MVASLSVLFFSCGGGCSEFERAIGWDHRGVCAGILKEVHNADAKQQSK